MPVVSVSLLQDDDATRITVRHADGKVWRFARCTRQDAAREGRRREPGARASRRLGSVGAFAAGARHLLEAQSGGLAVDRGRGGTIESKRTYGGMPLASECTTAMALPKRGLSGEPRPRPEDEQGCAIRLGDAHADLGRDGKQRSAGFEHVIRSGQAGRDSTPTSNTRKKIPAPPTRRGRRTALQRRHDDCRPMLQAWPVHDVRAFFSLSGPPCVARPKRLPRPSIPRPAAPLGHPTGGLCRC